MELIIAIALIVAGAFGGIYLSNRMSKKAESLDPDRGLPEPKNYPPMPKVKTQIPPKAPPPPKGQVPKPAAWPPAPPAAKPPPPPPPPPIRMMQSHTGREIPKPTQPVDDGFATSMALGAVSGSAAMGYLVGGNIAGAMLGAAMNSDEEPSKKSETYSSPSYSNDDDSYSKPSSSYDSGSSWGSSDDSSSSSSWSND